MPKYRVEVTHTVTDIYEDVEATNESEAEDNAVDGRDPDDVYYHDSWDYKVTKTK